jgi:hypothetical protein
MALPGFTAEASVGPTTQIYRMRDGYGIGAADVYPQSSDGDLDGGLDEGGLDEGGLDEGGLDEGGLDDGGLDDEAAEEGAEDDLGGDMGDET